MWLVASVFPNIKPSTAMSLSPPKSPSPPESPSPTDLIKVCLRAISESDGDTPPALASYPGQTNAISRAIVNPGQRLSVEVEFDSEFTLDPKKCVCISLTADGVKLAQECVTLDNLPRTSSFILSTGVIERQLCIGGPPEWRSLNPIKVGDIDDLVDAELKGPKLSNQEEQNFSLVRVEVHRCTHSARCSRDYDLKKHRTTRIDGYLAERTPNLVSHQRCIDMTSTNEGEEPRPGNCKPDSELDIIHIWRLCSENQPEQEMLAGPVTPAPRTSLDVGNVAVVGEEREPPEKNKKKKKKVNTKTAKNVPDETSPSRARPAKVQKRNAAIPTAGSEPISRNLFGASSDVDPRGSHQVDGNEKNQTSSQPPGDITALQDTGNMQSVVAYNDMTEVSNGAPTEEDVAKLKEKISAIEDVLTYHANIASSANSIFDALRSDNASFIRAREQLADYRIALVDATKNQKRKRDAGHAEGAEDIVDKGASQGVQQREKIVPRTRK